MMTRTFWDGNDSHEPTSSGPLHDFASAIAQGHAPKTSLEQAMVVQKITDAIYQSATTGKSVEMA
jgi:predicted dehydrogenase